MLARLVGAELQVSDDGELLFVFEKPGALSRSLRTSSLRQRVKDTWTAASPPIYWLARASFGLGLLASLALVTTAITVLASSKDSNSDSGSTGRAIGTLWGPSPFDFLYYSTRPYGYYGYQPPGEKGFLQSCFSLLFGDGNPNLDLNQRVSVAAAAIIRANDGAVTAEQLAPLLAPDFDPEQYEEESDRAGAPVREDWMLPILLQFNGEPVVTDEGDLVYVFEDLMSTAEDGSAVAGVMGAAGGGALTTAGPRGSPSAARRRPSPAASAAARTRSRCAPRDYHRRHNSGPNRCSQRAWPQFHRRRRRSRCRRPNRCGCSAARSGWRHSPYPRSRTRGRAPGRRG